MFAYDSTSSQLSPVSSGGRFSFHDDDEFDAIAPVSAIVLL